MPTLICSSCGKTYKDNVWYKKHIEKCKLINVIDNKTEMNNVELTRTVQYLLEMVREQDVTIKSLKKWASREKKKCNIVDWLNSCYDHTSNIACFNRKIKLTEKDLNYIFKTNFVEGVTTILQNILIGENIPIRCFDKDRKFYVKKDKWVCNTNDLTHFIDLIVTKLIKHFSEWTCSNSKLVLNDRTNDDYLKKLQLLVITSDEKKNKYKVIEKNMYTFLKESLKSVVEYEFIF